MSVPASRIPKLNCCQNLEPLPQLPDCSLRPARAAASPSPRRSSWRMPLAGSDPKLGPLGASGLCPPQHPQGLAEGHTSCRVRRTWKDLQTRGGGGVWPGLWPLWAGLTDGAEGMLELQGEGSEGHVLRHRHDGHRGEVAGGDPRVPLATCRVQPELVTCEAQGPVSAGPVITSRCP